MGAYRTGKSFLLDLFLRYLTYRTENLVALDKKSSGNKYPEWLVHEGEVISEGRTGLTGKIGFEWRGGMDKVTEGLWLWSRPFVIDQGGPDESPDNANKVCVLLLDSQGAFDSKLTKEQSATIFGLTAILSSHQIYNVSKQIQEDTLDNLHYFMECAGSCLRILETDKGESPESAVFQNLQFLVRDWANFEEGWSMARCEQQMGEHLKQHLDNARDPSTPQALRDMFRTVSCWMLPHPGLIVNKTTWTGDIHDLDDEFITSLDVYVQRLFSRSLLPKSILGKPLSASTFVDVVATLANAFTGLIPEGINLATALARTTNLISKEQSLQQYRHFLDELLNGKYKKGLPIEEFHTVQSEARSAALDTFAKGTKFGPVSEREAVQKELILELDRLGCHYVDENRRRMESALTSFAGICLLICMLYAIDKLSDITCDWYSQTCVRMSNALLLIYSMLTIAILTNVYLLLQSKGRTVTVIAVIEMGKSVISLAMDLGGCLAKLFRDLKESNTQQLLTDARGLWSQFVQEIMRGVTDIQSAISR